MPLYLRNARLIDGTGQAPLEGAGLLIERDTLRTSQVFVEVLGFSPLEAIEAATRHGVELMRMPDRIGTLEPGKLADLVVVDGDPVKDITVLQDRARLSVMKGGQFLTSNLS